MTEDRHRWYIWWFYTTERTPAYGTTGPFGPIRSTSEESARKQAEARCQRLGYTFARLERDNDYGER